jgi:SAM-dependent methyltransferase
VVSPIGSITRGTTHPNRLRRFDRWILHRLGATMRRAPDPVVVDLGFGASPVTTVELADRLAVGAGRAIRVVGLEIDPERVRAAQAISRPHVRFARGGFELPLPGDERPLMVRAANGLRQYTEAEGPGAWAVMAQRLAPGGLVVEGTCDEVGRLAAWVAIPATDGPARDPVAPRSLTLSVDLRHLERPSQVAERLPKALIHHNVPGTGVHALMRDLDRAWDRAAPQGVFGPRQRWLSAVGALRESGWPVADGPTRWRLGECTVDWRSVSPGW